MTIELIADGIHLPATILRLAYKLKGVEKTCMHLRAVRVLAGIVGIAVQKQNAVGVLLVGAGVAQVGKLGPVAGVVALFFHRTGFFHVLLFCTDGWR